MAPAIPPPVLPDLSLATAGGGSRVTTNTTIETGPETTKSTTTTEARHLGVGSIVGIVLGGVGLFILAIVVVKLITYWLRKRTNPQLILNTAYKEAKREWKKEVKKRRDPNDPIPAKPRRPIACHCPRGREQDVELPYVPAGMDNVCFVAPPRRL